MFLSVAICPIVQGYGLTEVRLCYRFLVGRACLGCLSEPDHDAPCFFLVSLRIGLRYDGIVLT